MARSLVAGVLAITLVGCATPPSTKLAEAVDRGDATAATQALKEVTPSQAAAQVLSRAAAGQTGALRLLLDAGAAADVPALKEQALGEAARAGRLEATRLLLDRGARIDWQADALQAKPNAAGWVPAEAEKAKDYANLGPYEAPSGKVFNLKLVEAKGAGNSALSLAVIHERIDVVRLLLARGADKELVVIYKDPQFAVLNVMGEGGRGLFMRPRGDAMQVNVRGEGGRALSFKNEGGAVVTNSPFAFERKARIADLGESSDDATIRGLFRND